MSFMYSQLHIKKGLRFYLLSLFIGVIGTSSVFAKPPPLPDCPTLSDGQKIQLGFDYPYKRPFSEPPYSYLYVRGKVYRYHNFAKGMDDLLTNATVLVNGKAIAVKTLLKEQDLSDIASMEKRWKVIGYGANAAASALRRKYCNKGGFDGNGVFPVIKGELKDFDIVYSPHFVFNGTMPSSIVVSKGTGVQVYITFLDDNEKKYMDDTEGVPGMYSVGELNHIQLKLETGNILKTATVYVDCNGALKINNEVIAIDAVPASKRRFITTDEKGALERLFPEIKYSAGTYCFVWENVTDKECRNLRDSQAKPYNAPFDYPDYTPEQGKGCQPAMPVKVIPDACTHCGGT